MFGDNTGGQLAQLDVQFDPLPKQIYYEGQPLRVKKISGTQYSTLCITLEDKLLVWGDVFLWQDELATYNRKPNLCQPKLVDLKSKRPFDIACGCNHVVIITEIEI